MHRAINKQRARAATHLEIQKAIVVIILFAVCAREHLSRVLLYFLRAGRAQNTHKLTDAIDIFVTFHSLVILCRPGCVAY